jgi:hypothetical protein
VIEEVSPARDERDATRAPDFIEPLVGFRSWRLVDGRLRSVYLPVFWDDAEKQAECLDHAAPDADARRSAPPGHAVPDRGCTCGIYAYYEPDMNFPTVDYRGVCGIVTLPGTIELHEDGMRAEQARIEALALYSRWTTRQLDAVRDVAVELGVDVVDLDEIVESAQRYGRHVDRELVPGARSEQASH